MTKNKMLVNLWLDQGCSQKDGEVSISYAPINFLIHSPLFIDMINEAVAAWLSENEIPNEHDCELIFQHVIEHDGAGATHTEYFELLNCDF